MERPMQVKRLPLLLGRYENKQCVLNDLSG